jgi:phospholipid/cholesterol/gamma-HCH transport system substrate-binding protein
MAGVSVGEVESIRLDPKTFQAVVGVRLYPKYSEIPDDSFASIQTQGLLGGKYIGLSPGGSETFLKEGSRIDQTQSAIVLESLINKLFASFASKAGSDSQSQAPSPQTQGPSPSAPAADPKKQEPKK